MIYLGAAIAIAAFVGGVMLGRRFSPTGAPTPPSAEAVDSARAEDEAAAQAQADAQAKAKAVMGESDSDVAKRVAELRERGKAGE